jgi:Flp pilus assembly protein TadG
MRGTVMKLQKKARILPRHGEDGVVAMEFVILFPLFFLILAGIVEFGHLFYVRHTLTNASREGARAAVIYHVTSDRQTWAKATAKSTVTKYLADTKFGGTYSVDPVAGSTSGSLVTVTVTAPSSLLVLDVLVPALKNLSVSAETTMKME